MKKAQKPVYRYCIVPECKNTIRSAPDKVFFRVPFGAIRKKWCKVIRRDEVSPTTCLHCCGDHFNIEEDTENYVQYNIMKQEGVNVTLRLNKGVLPHIFHCRNRNMPPPIIRMGAIKRKRLSLIEEALSKYTASSSNAMEICEPPQTNNDEVESCFSHIEEINSSENEMLMERKARKDISIFIETSDCEDQLASRKMDNHDAVEVKLEQKELIIKGDPEEVVEGCCSLDDIRSETNPFTTNAEKNMDSHNDFNVPTIKLEQEKFVIKNEPEEVQEEYCSFEFINCEADPFTTNMEIKFEPSIGGTAHLHNIPAQGATSSCHNYETK